MKALNAIWPVVMTAALGCSPAVDPEIEAQVGRLEAQLDARAVEVVELEKTKKRLEGEARKLLEENQVLRSRTAVLVAKEEPCEGLAAAPFKQPN